MKNKYDLKQNIDNSKNDDKTDKQLIKSSKNSDSISNISKLTIYNNSNKDN